MSPPRAAVSSTMLEAHGNGNDLAHRLRDHLIGKSGHTVRDGSRSQAVGRHSMPLFAVDLVGSRARFDPLSRIVGKPRVFP